MVNYPDILLESIRSVILGGMIFFLWVEGKKRRKLSRKGWNFILAGLLLLLFGSILDISDEIPALNPLAWGEPILEKMIGEAGGFLLLAFGLLRWIPTVTQLEESEAALRNSQTTLRNLAGKLIYTNEEERRKVARELHDDFVQRLAALAIEVGNMEKNGLSVPEPLRERIGEIRGEIVKLSEDIQNTSRQLHPSILEDLGLVGAIESACARFSEREGIQVEFSSRNVPRNLPRDISLCLYRIFQESMRNIAKHSGARNIQVFLREEDRMVCLTIRDSGVGFELSRVRGKGGLGLASMEERVRLVLGKLSIDSRPGEGTTIEVRAPVSEQME
ncbi:MAG: sensor histidine kinase [Acidobacteriota bacterium]